MESNSHEEEMNPSSTNPTDLETSTSSRLDGSSTESSLNLTALALNEKEDGSRPAPEDSIQNATLTTSQPGFVQNGSAYSSMQREPAKSASLKSAKAGASHDPEKPRFIIKMWAPIIPWHWRIQEDKCAICKRELDELCMYCIADLYEETSCFMVTGKCGHVFHEHCMEFWLRKSPTCPLDSSQWEEKLALSYGAYTDYDLNHESAIRESMSDSFGFVDEITGEMFAGND